MQLACMSLFNMFTCLISCIYFIACLVDGTACLCSSLLFDARVKVLIRLVVVASAGVGSFCLLVIVFVFVNSLLLEAVLRFLYIAGL